MQHEAQLATTMAWMTAAFTRQKKLPPLRKVLGQKDKPKAQQSVAEQAAIIRALHARLGGELTTGGNAAK